jgi:hypothetical protein
MREIWDHPFGHALLKVDRAEKHIADIDKRLVASSDAYGTSLHCDIKTGEQFLHYRLTDTTLRADIALIVGDAIHNLRSALDFAWCGTLDKINPGSGTTWTHFPLPDSKTKLIGDLAKTGEIDPTSRLFDFMVERVKSYKGGDDDICAIHALDIDDKHQLLIPMVAVTGISGVELENEDGSIDRFDIVLTRPNSYRKVVTFGAKFKNHGEVRFQVTFGQGILTQDLPVVPTLLRFHAKVYEIVRHLQRLSG